MSLISIIVPAYNVENYIDRCLDSILGQTYKNLQIIVVDDGSTDSTASICDEYGKKDSRIEVIHQKNAGLSGARNAGLRVARGDYIGYVDGDDYIEPVMYEKMINAMTENSVNLVVCGYNQIGPQGEKYNFSRKNIVLSREEALDVYVSDNREFHIFNSVWSKLFEKDIVKGLEFPVGHNSEDILYTTKALVNCNGVVFVDDPLYNYVLDREGSIMNASKKLSHRRFNDEIPFTFEQIEYFRQNGFDEIAGKDEYYVYRRLTFYYLDFRHRKMKEDAKKLANLIRKDRAKVKEIFCRDYVKGGDNKRMKLFLFSPGLYYHVNNIYEKTVLKLRK